MSGQAMMSSGFSAAGATQWESLHIAPARCVAIKIKDQSKINIELNKYKSEITPW